MSPSNANISELRAGADHARDAKLPRLGRLLDSLAALGALIRDGNALDVAVAADEAVTYGAVVARDLARNANRGCAADAEVA